MKRPLAIAALTLLCAGCGFLQSKLTTDEPLASKNLVICGNAPVQLQATCNEAVKVIEKSDILLAAADDTIAQNVGAQVWTKAESQAYLDRSKDAGQKLDAAFATLTKGGYLDALSQANLTNALILKLQKDIAAKARKSELSPGMILIRGTL